MLMLENLALVLKGIVSLSIVITYSSMLTVFTSCKKYGDCFVYVYMQFIRYEAFSSFRIKSFITVFVFEFVCGILVSSA